MPQKAPSQFLCRNVNWKVLKKQKQGNFSPLSEYRKSIAENKKKDISHPKVLYHLNFVEYDFDEKKTVL